MADNTYIASGNSPLLSMNTDNKPEDLKEGMYTYALNVTNYVKDFVTKLVTENRLILNDTFSIDDINVIDILGRSELDRYAYIFVYFPEGTGQQLASYDSIMPRPNEPDDIAIIEFNKDEKAIERIKFLSKDVLDNKHFVSCESLYKNGSTYLYFSNGYTGVYAVNFDSENIVARENGKLDTIIKDFILVKNNIRSWDDMFRVEVVNGGNLRYGKYYIYVRQVDKDGNFTPWRQYPNYFLIYNTFTEHGPYTSIEGSIIDKNIYVNKSLRISYPPHWKYRGFQVGVVHSAGNVEGGARAYISDVIIGTGVYNLSNLSNLEAYDYNEFQYSAFSFSGYKSVKSYENRLVVGNINFNEKKYYELQRIASRMRPIVNIRRIDEDEFRADYASTNFTLLPGEVYAFGVVFIFNDGTISPVFHIPGPAYKQGCIEPHFQLNEYYSDDAEFWGVDSQGIQLAGTRVRHFRISDETDSCIRDEGTNNGLYAYKIDLSFSYDSSSFYDEYGISDVIFVMNRNDDKYRRVFAYAYGFHPVISGDKTIISTLKNTKFKTLDKSKLIIISPEIDLLNRIKNGLYVKLINSTRLYAEYMKRWVFYDVLPDDDNSIIFNLIHSEDFDTQLCINTIKYVPSNIVQYFDQNGYIVESAYDVKQTTNINGIWNFSMDNDFVVLQLDREVSTNDTDVLYYMHLYDPAFNMPSLSDIEYVQIGTGYGGYSYVRTESTTYVGYVDNGTYQLLKSFARILGYIIEMVALIALAVATGGATVPVLIAAAAYLQTTIGIGLETYNIIQELVDSDSGIRNAILNLDGASDIVHLCDDAKKIIFQHSSLFRNIIPTHGVYDQMRLASETMVSFPTISNITDTRQYLTKKFLFADKAKGTNDEASYSFKPIIDQHYEVYDESLLTDIAQIFYSFDYNKINSLNDFIGNRIYWTDVYHDTDSYDKLRDIRPLNYKDIEDIDTEIRAIETIGMKLFVFSDNFVFYFPKPIQEKIASDFDIYVGTGQFLSIGPFKMVDDSKFGYGTIFPMSIIKLTNSIYYVASNGHVVRIADKLEDITNVTGTINYFDYLSDFRAFSSYSSITGQDYPIVEKYLSKFAPTWISVYDNKRKRILFTQKDFMFTSDPQYNQDYDVFDNTDTIELVGTTISYSLITESFISLHSYQPVTYLSTRDNILLLMTDENFDIGVYYFSDDEYMNYSIVEVPVKTKDSTEFILAEVIVDTYGLRANRDVIRQYFYDSILIHNSYQTTGIKAVNLTNNDSLLSKITEDSNNIKVRFIEGSWHINRIRDYRANNDEPMFELADRKYIYKNFNQNSVDLHKQWQDIVPMRDTYALIRFIRNKQQTEDTANVIDVMAVIGQKVYK